MRLVIQRVTSCRLHIDDKLITSIGKGLLVLVGIGKEDTSDFTAMQWLANKMLGLRIFEDENGKMNLSLLDIKGDILLVSQFTLYADCRKGRRPGFDKAAPPQIAEKLFNKFVEITRKMHPAVKTGVFGAHMKINLINDGPVTIILEK